MSNIFMKVFWYEKVNFIYCCSCIYANDSMFKNRKFLMNQTKNLLSLEKYKLII